MKKRYIKAEIELLYLKTDVITGSGGGTKDPDMDGDGWHIF